VWKQRARSPAAGIPSRGGLSAFSVNRPGWECIRQSLYDSIVVPAGNINQLQFFQEGQGGPLGKTASDTNLEAAAMIPADQEWLIESIEFHYFGYVPPVTTQLPAYYNGEANWSDANNNYPIAHGFQLTLMVGSKPYLQDGPFVRFPPKTHFDVHAALADASTRAGGQYSRISFNFMTGAPYTLSPAEIWLEGMTDFSVTLTNFAGVFALPQPSRMVCVLDGFCFRRPQ
jgi:hypothetical protein